ncbi:hypothetical protein ACNJYD_02745 [Bradyrhizobium sp. DASA03005]|uniref:hypothetical protein n=1 Tax=Bradyrhizobium sp. SPXBL-02 TaxID=3395912 RepID=UPI003F6E8B06
MAQFLIAINRSFAAPHQRTGAPYARNRCSNEPRICGGDSELASSRKTSLSETPTTIDSLDEFVRLSIVMEEVGL